MIPKNVRSHFFKTAKLNSPFLFLEEPNGLDAVNISYILEEDLPIKTML